MASAQILECSVNLKSSLKGLSFLEVHLRVGLISLKISPSLFSAQVHQQLCLSEGIQSFNYGAAERDNFTLARPMDLVLSAPRPIDSGDVDT